MIKADYAHQLRTYSEAFQKLLLFAIYWVKWGVWTLNPLSDFTPAGAGYSLSLCDAPKNDQKWLLGDSMIAIPKPLALRFFADPTKPSKVEPDGNLQFTIGRVAFVAGEREISNELEKKLAGFFLLYAPWENVSNPAKIVDGRVIHYDIQGIRQDPNPDQQFLMLGYLSEMISRQFNEMTVAKGKVLHLTPEVSPDKLGVVIPTDYKSEVLCIWRFSIQPERPVLDWNKYRPNAFPRNPAQHAPPITANGRPLPPADGAAPGRAVASGRTKRLA